MSRKQVLLAGVWPVHGRKIADFWRITRNSIFLSYAVSKECHKSLRVQKIRIFSPLAQKNFAIPAAKKVCTMGCPRSQFTILGFASVSNLRAIWAIFLCPRAINTLFLLVAAACLEKTYFLTILTRKIVYEPLL